MLFVYSIDTWLCERIYLGDPVLKSLQ